jgi:hypothetical protein
VTLTFPEKSHFSLRSLSKVFPHASSFRSYNRDAPPSLWQKLISPCDFTGSAVVWRGDSLFFFSFLCVHFTSIAALCMRSFGDDPDNCLAYFLLLICSFALLLLFLDLLLENPLFFSILIPYI